MDDEDELDVLISPPHEPFMGGGGPRCEDCGESDGTVCPRDYQGHTVYLCRYHWRTLVERDWERRASDGRIGE